ncbi:nucleoside hydrolase [Desulfoluna butyratoxydans]|uniref:Inosine-uridine preferring nucleoside hydrolase n=1 Tax=Desulfoluna butyratoxydans TaxID=231438 RepID=A0A4U8YGZ3_9BACT|nr:nucleoside hydrolase [Desulfoluna butyratoxydans]VFQ42781.1 inosine-uridine preferring nucleoside hydrolase [Desulfoluna butyratoxydans]
MNPARKRVIVDSDMGWDDILSILCLMKHPSVDLLGICVTGCGETDLRWGTLIAKTLTELANRPRIRVCAGTSTPMGFDHRFPQPFKDEMNSVMGLLGSLNPSVSFETEPRPAWQFLADTLEATDEKITLLCLGGFTNPARMMDTFPAPRIDNIEKIVAMAGAVYVDGNVALLNNARDAWDQGPVYATNHGAEWNVFIDPVAAKRIVDSPIPLTLVPLDACNHVLLGPDMAEALTAVDPLATLAKRILLEKTGPHNEGIPVPVFDPLATLVMTGDMQSCQSYRAFLDIDMTENETNNRCGTTRVSRTGSRKVTVIQGGSRQEFKARFAALLNGTGKT